jgi:hypothetical protein
MFLIIALCIIVLIIYILSKNNVNEKKNIVYVNEEECREIFERIFNEKFPKIRHEKIINPKTNRRLELDGYNEKLKLAFEYQGEQHYKKTGKYNKTNKALEYQQFKDEIKRSKCKEIGITLIEIPYHVENKEEFIKLKIKEMK